MQNKFAKNYKTTKHTLNEQLLSVFVKNTSRAYYALQVSGTFKIFKIIYVGKLHIRVRYSLHGAESFLSS